MKSQRLAFFDGTQVSGGNDPETRTLPESILLVKFGTNHYTKGSEQGKFDFTESDADSIIADFASRGRDLVIDFEHQTLSGGKAPAAGWIDKLEKTAEGLAAKIKYWTKEAEGFLLNGEYRYFSPTLYFSRSGKSVSAIHSVALTNHPAMHEAPALVADDTSDEPAGSGLNEAAAEGLSDNDARKEEDAANSGMAEVLDALGLVALADSPEKDQRKAITEAICGLAAKNARLDSFLKLHDFTDLDDADAKMKDMIPASLKAELETQLKKRDALTLVAQAFSDGKLAECSRVWAVSFAERDGEAFSEWCRTAPRIIPDNKDTEDSDVAGKPTPASEEAMKIFRLLGLSEEQMNGTAKE